MFDEETNGELEWPADAPRSINQAVRLPLEPPLQRRLSSADARRLRKSIAWIGLSIPALLLLLYFAAKDFGLYNSRYVAYAVAAFTPSDSDKENPVTVSFFGDQIASSDFWLSFKMPTSTKILYISNLRRLDALKSDNFTSNSNKATNTDNDASCYEQRTQNITADGKLTIDPLKGGLVTAKSLHTILGSKVYRVDVSSIPGDPDQEGRTKTVVCAALDFKRFCYNTFAGEIFVASSLNLDVTGLNKLPVKADFSDLVYTSNFTFSHVNAAISDPSHAQLGTGGSIDFSFEDQRLDEDKERVTLFAGVLIAAIVACVIEALRPWIG